MRVIVIGATGFIGRNFLQYFSGKHKKDIPIVALVRDSSRNKDAVCNIAGIDIKSFTSLHKDEVKDFLEKKDIVVYCAGYVGNDKQRLYEVNELATYEVLQACMEQQVSRVVYLSSVAVISGNKEIPLRDDMPFKSSMPYGESKLRAEKIVWDFIDKGLNIVVLRPAMVYGKGEPHMLPKVFNLMIRRLFFLFGNGDNLWHLCGIYNLIAVMEQAVFDDRMLNRPFIVADEEVLTAREIFDTLSICITGRPVKKIPEWASLLLMRLPKIGRIVKFMRKQRLYDISGIKKLGYKDKISPIEGLKLSAEGRIERH